MAGVLVTTSDGSRQFRMDPLLPPAPAAPDAAADAELRHRRSTVKVNDFH